MTSSRSWTHRAAMLFYEWLVERKDEELPPLHEISVMLPETIDPYRLSHSIQWLAKQGMIDVGHKRGHYIIRVRSTGVVYRTADCPFDLPANGNAGQGGPAGVQREQCDGQDRKAPAAAAHRQAPSSDWPHSDEFWP